MFITVDILQKHGAFAEDINDFLSNYPLGADATQVFNDNKLNIDFLHWMCEFLELDTEEQNAYWKMVNVSNSEGVRESLNVLNSSLVSASIDVTNSEKVYGSESVTNSTSICDSDFVECSKYICDSKFVTNSEKVYKGQNIENSEEVVDVKYVINSYGIYEANNVVDCDTIWQGEDLTNCHFCFKCYRLSSALFCYDISDGEYYLFNKKIDKNRFDMIMKQYNKYFKQEMCLIDNWKDTYHYPTKIYDFRKHTAKMPDTFWAWVQTLPGYDPSILYSLTFNPRFLT